MQDKFENIIEKHKTRLEQDNKLFDKLGYVKVLAVIAVVVCVVFLFASGFEVLAVITSVAFFAVSVALWVWHYRLDNKIKYAKGIILICRNHIDRITGEWTNFSDTGSEFTDYYHHYACDLDIAGTNSFFQFINTTHTWHGRQMLAASLLRPDYSIDEIKQRQQAVEELSRDTNFANDIQYFLSEIGASVLDEKLTTELSDSSPIKLWLANNPHSKLGKAVRLLVKLMPVLTVLMFAAGGIFQIRPLLIVGIIFLLDQIVLCHVERNTVHDYLGIMNRLPYKLGKYVKVIDIFTAKNFSSVKLNEIKCQLQTAREAVKELEKISNAISTWANPLIYIILKWLLLWDFYCVFSLEKWKVKYSHLAQQWFSAIGEFESLLSFSHLPNVCDNVCLPEIHESGKMFEAAELGHPLLLNDRRVNNSVKFDNNIFIISGSNMSGKTTFMRTVGVNLLLAKAGSFVCAAKMTCSRFDIITSMRIADDLNQGVSTFYAELKRIKLILDLALENPQLVFLIDEIFKGTNSVDRLAGAYAVISKLEKLNAPGIITTHDLELCKLANLHQRILNYSFCENYKDGEIIFDYIMQEGQSKTTNARFLMEMVGI